jgi:hypothetical protein
MCLAASECNIVRYERVAFGLLSALRFYESVAARWSADSVVVEGVMAEVAGVQLAEFVDALRDQIRIAQAGADPALPIDVGPITLEFTVTTRREGAGKAGVKFWVVDAGVSGKLGNESMQKVTMQLIPHAPDGQGPARIRDRESASAGSGGSPLRDIERD